MLHLVGCAVEVQLRCMDIRTNVKLCRQIVCSLGREKLHWEQQRKIFCISFGNFDTRKVKVKVKVTLEQPLRLCTDRTDH
jgi:hypothetical protein